MSSSTAAVRTCKAQDVLRHRTSLAITCEPQYPEGALGRAAGSSCSKAPFQRKRADQPLVLQPVPDALVVLTERRRGGVRRSGQLRPVGREEPQRRPGQLERAQRGVLDVDEQPLRAASGPSRRPRRGSALARAGRRPRSSRASRSSARRRRTRPPAERSPRRGAPPGRRWSPCPGPPGRGRTRRRTAATATRCRRPPARCRRRSGTGRTGDRRVVVALRAADLAGHRPAGALEGVHADDRGQQRRAHDLPAAGARPARAARPARRRRRTCRPAGRRSGRRPAAGRPGPEPVIDIRPPSPWAIWS